MTEEYFILFIVSWLMAVALKSFAHFYIIEIERTDPHKDAQTRIQNWLFTGMASILHGVAWDVQFMWEYGFIVLFQTLSHMVMFGPGLNMLRKDPYFYLGKGSGWFDEFFVTRPVTYRVVYFMFCILTVYSVILLRKISLL